MTMAREKGGLPERCHAVLPGLPAGSNIAVCVRGEKGVRLTRLNFGDTDAARKVVLALNASLGIDGIAERTMLAGCLLGWHAITSDLERGDTAPWLH